MHIMHGIIIRDMKMMGCCRHNARFCLIPISFSQGQIDVCIALMDHYLLHSLLFLNNNMDDSQRFVYELFFIVCLAPVT